MRGPFANLGRYFTRWSGYVGGEADTTVTLAQVDPDTGDATATAEAVQALKLSDTGQPMSVGQSGEVGVTTCQFWLTGDGLEFAPKYCARITESDGVTGWRVTSVERVGFGPTGTLYRCPVILERV